MTLNDKPAVMPGVYTFTDVLDETCEKLIAKQVKYSIRRIQEMEEHLFNLEKALDEFLAPKDMD